MRGHLGAYSELIAGFVDRGYRPIFFDGLTGAAGELIIRHDVDFDCELAHALSLLEDEIGVRTTWFFLLRSMSYNPFSGSDAQYVRSIHARGHRVGIHFDPTLYDDIRAGFSEEKALFEGFFDIPLRIASIHRPNEFLKNCNAPLCGVEHTYQDKYFKEITYLSDSHGLFRFGHPFESEACKQRRPIHLLLHPLWWMFPHATGNVDLLERFLAYRVAKFQRHMADNCTPYRTHIGL